MTDEGAADEGCDNEADSTDDRSPKLTTGKVCTARRLIIDGRTYGVRVSEYLAGCDGNDKCDRESEAQNPVPSSSESDRVSKRA